MDGVGIDGRVAGAGAGAGLEAVGVGVAEVVPHSGALGATTVTAPFKVVVDATADRKCLSNRHPRLWTIITCRSR